MERQIADYWLYYLLMTGASVMLVISLLFVRTRVRKIRQRTVDELRMLFFEGAEVSVAAFDYVRAKYEMPTRPELDGKPALAKPTSTAALLGSAIPYILICAIGFLMLGLPFAELRAGSQVLPLVYDSLFWSMAGSAPSDAHLREAAAVFAAAFLGGYLMTGRMLLRAVQNYELTQLTFLQAATQLVFGIVSGMMVYHVLRGIGVITGFVGDVQAFPGFLLIAFIGGYVPTLGLTVLVQHLRIRLFKTVDRKALETAKAIPLEVIEGVDYDIAQRLEQSGIADAQNLATSNPLLLYIETPFGLYCAFDWVLQAQLCASVGSDTFAALKRYNIRTSLDLERAVLADDAPDEFVRALGPILFSTKEGEEELTPKAIRHGVMVMLDDLHVHRVRMLWRHVFAQIAGPEQSQWLYRTEQAKVPDRKPPVPDTAEMVLVPEAARRRARPKPAPVNEQPQPG